MDDTIVRDGMLSVMRENPEQPQGIVEDIRLCPTCIAAMIFRWARVAGTLLRTASVGDGVARPSALRHGPDRPRSFRDYLANLCHADNQRRH
jgi:hypothetical protein